MKKNTVVKLVVAGVLFALAAALLFRTNAAEGEPEALAPEVRQAVEQANRESASAPAGTAPGPEPSAPAFMPSARPTEPGGK